MSDLVLEKVVESLVRGLGWTNPTFTEKEWTTDEWTVNSVLQLGVGIGVLYHFESSRILQNVVGFHFPEIARFRSPNGTEVIYNKRNMHRERHVFNVDGNFCFISGQNNKITVFSQKVEVLDFIVNDTTPEPISIAKFLLITP